MSGYACTYRSTMWYPNFTALKFGEISIFRKKILPFFGILLGICFCSQGKQFHTITPPKQMRALLFIGHRCLISTLTKVSRHLCWSLVESLTEMLEGMRLVSGIYQILAMALLLSFNLAATLTAPFLLLSIAVASARTSLHFAT